MRPAIDLLSQYALYHRDRRNIASHFVGVPMIVFAVGVLLARPVFGLGALALTPAWIAFGLAAAWYLTRGNLVLGIATSAAVGVLILAAHHVGSSGVGAWLAWGIGFFAVGWVIQFVGHWYEGKKPAFVDDIIETPFGLDAQGFLDIPQLPGLGVSLDRARLARYTPDPSPLFAA